MHVAPAVSLKGLGPGLVPLRTRPCSWGEGGVHAPPPPPSPVKSLLAHPPGPAVPRASFLGCPLLSWAALYCCCVGECVLPLLVSVLVWRWRSCRGSRWSVVRGRAGGGCCGLILAVLQCCPVCSLPAFPAHIWFCVGTLSIFAAFADNRDDDFALSPPQKVNAHFHLPDLLRSAPRAVFRLLASFSVILVNCMCGMLC